MPNENSRVAQVIKQNDNLTEKPSSKSSEHASIVTGDLHDNDLKILHFLIQNNIVQNF